MLAAAITSISVGSLLSISWSQRSPSEPCKIIGETEKAWKIQHMWNNAVAWIPKSGLEKYRLPKCLEGTREVDANELVVRDWLTVKASIQQMRVLGAAE